MAGSFSVRKPQSAQETPLVVEVPHAGLSIDAQTLAFICAPARSIARDADLYVDELYADAPERGATLIVSHVSRYVVDLNRGEQDVDADAVEGAPSSARATRGIVWRLTSDGAKVLERPLPRAELERRLDALYRPYHRTIAETLLEKKAKFGFAVLLAAHSMPSVGRGAQRPAAEAGRPDVKASRADVVPGTRGRTSAGKTFIDAVEAHAHKAGYTVSHDDPYQGGFTTQTYGRPADGIHVVQVELARRLYMDEATLAKNGSFAAVRGFCGDLVTLLGRLRP